MRTYVIALLCLAGCATRRPAPPSNVTLPVLSAEASRPFVLQQHLHGAYGEREVDADVVLQFQDGVLRLIGLAPFGARAFVVEQHGAEVQVESSLGRELPFDPKHVLVDIHRVLFSGALSGLEDGQREHEAAGEQVRERWSAGHLVERSFAAPGHRPVVVHYSDAPTPVLAPDVELRNEELGYRLHIQTTSQQWL